MTEFAREYGNALYSLCVEEQIAPEILAQLADLEDCFEREPDFLRLLTNMSLPKAERLSILDAALRAQVHPYLLNFLKILCERAALNRFGECCAVYRDSFNFDNRIIEATVSTREPLTDAQRARMQQKLSKLTGQQVALREKLDPSVLDGVLLEMEGQRYDDTLRNRLARIRRAMLGEAQ